MQDLLRQLITDSLARPVPALRRVMRVCQRCLAKP